MLAETTDEQVHAGIRMRATDAHSISGRILIEKNRNRETFQKKRSPRVYQMVVMTRPRRSDSISFLNSSALKLAEAKKRSSGCLPASGK